jgi:chromatin structure-remodeling complex subunit SFH1
LILQTLCNSCGLIFERDKKLPVWNEALHKHTLPLGLGR